jgi:hypothetical protein
MLYREIIAVCSETHTKHINTLRGQIVEFVNVKPGGTYSNHWALKIELTLPIIFKDQVPMSQTHTEICWRNLKDRDYLEDLGSM